MSRIKRPADIPPQPSGGPVLSGPCASGNHNRCTGRVYNANRATPDAPRFVPCDCPKRTCSHAEQTRARHRALREARLSAPVSSET